MPRKPFIIVAIDGGAASGKSSTSRILGERFNLLHSDTGSYYRAVTAEMLRAALLDYQRGQADAARKGGFKGLVMEGRDIGSVIFPDADFRFFLHADPAEREKRRVREGQHDKVAERDRIDSSRKTAPLSCPEGAISIDTTRITIAEVVDKMASIVAA